MFDTPKALKSHYFDANAVRTAYDIKLPNSLKNCPTSVEVSALEDEYVNYVNCYYLNALHSKWCAWSHVSLKVLCK